MTAQKRSTMMTPDEIARGLTDAQKRAVADAKHYSKNGAWHPAGIYINADRRVRYNLATKNILRDYSSPHQRLTPLGLAVRQILQEQTND